MSATIASTIASYHSLVDLKPGELAIFVGFSAGKNLMSRLIALGFTPGAKVLMTQNLGRGPLLVSIRGSFVALGRGEAAKIIVDRKSV